MHMLVQVILHLESKRCRLCHLLFCRTIWLKTWRPLELTWTRRGYEGLPSITGRVLPRQLPSELSSVTRACLVCGQYGACRSGSHLKEPVAVWPARGKRHALFFRIEHGTRESGSHSTDKKLKTTGGGLGKWGADQLIFGCIHLRDVTDWQCFWRLTEG